MIIRSSVVLCNAPLRSFVGLLWSSAVLCAPLRYLVIPLQVHWSHSNKIVICRSNFIVWNSSERNVFAKYR